MSGPGVAGMILRIGGPGGVDGFCGVSGSAGRSLRVGVVPKVSVNSGFFGGLVADARIDIGWFSLRGEEVGDASGEDGAS